MCRFDSPCKANKPTGHETESTTRKRGRLPSNGLSSFRSRDVEHRHYVVCRLLALARVQPLPRHRGETGQRIREGTEPEKIFRMQILFRFLPLSLSLPLFLLRFHRSTFLPSTATLFKLLLLPTIPRDRLYASSVNSSYRGSFMLPNHIVEGKNRREREREN